ncbi:MAG TPA: YcnI family protein [Pseudonocardiaceae bacterium]|nr:YcnI family protein [Pseudonocardiaceae bacterium]
MLRPLTRATTLAALTAAALITAAASASAHVTVHSDQAVAGATDAAITFRVPNEEANAQTTKIQVIFPTDHPLIGVLIKDHPGWTADVQTAKLPTPVTTDDGPVSDAVSRVTWTGGAITGDNYDDFEVSAGQIPKDATDLTFKTLQTYSNGDVVSWIDTAPPGAPEPEHPAPVLHLAPAGSAASAGQDNGAGPSVSATTQTAAQSDGTTRTLSIAALVVAVVAALLAAAGLLRRRRSTS